MRGLEENGVMCGCSLKFWPGIPLVWVGALVISRAFFEFWGCFRVWGAVGRGGGLVWSGLMDKCGYSENFARGPPVLGRGSHQGSCILRFLGALRGLKNNGARRNLS